MKKIALIDFDGTIVEHDFPKIGKPMPQAFEVMKEMKDKGWKLILWTCREDEGNNINKRYLTDAVNFCTENGIEFDAVNETIIEQDFREKGKMRKPFFGVCIDDLNLGGFPGWDAVKRELLD